ncbi:MAG: hypothetical protein JW957_06240 [Candidatus Omnitrophica bacterium]|nr:hypothetical protein [Candidatus Omnitrophota bacterium]
MQEKTEGGTQQRLRCYIPPDKAEKRIAEIIRCCRRIGADGILLFTSSYDEDISFEPLENIAGYASLMRQWAEEFRKAGLKVGVNVLQTLGHVYYPETDDENLRFQRRISLDGKESGAGACPFCPKLRKYQSKAYSLYAGITPDIMFVDDDFRSVMGEGPSCMCPLHIQATGRALGREITFEELRDSLLKEGFNHEDQVRAAYNRVQRRGWREMAEMINRAVTAVSPETRLGLMSARYPSGTYGMRWQEVLDALAGRKQKPLMRPQISSYSDHMDIHLLPQVLQNPLIVRNLVSPEVIHYPEIENYTYTSWAKSTKLTVETIAWCLLNGFNNPALNIFDMYGSPLSEVEDLVSSLEYHRRYFEELYKLCSGGRPGRGVAMPVSPELCEVQRNLGDRSSFFSGNPFDEWLPLLGLPIGYDWEHSPWVLMQGDSLLSWSDEEIDLLLSRGAVLDRDATECLIHRGFGDRLGMRLGGPVPLDSCGMELFKSDKFSGAYAGRLYPARSLHRKEAIRQFYPSGREWTNLSVLLDYRKKEITPLVAVSESKKGERTAFLNFSKEDSRLSFCNNRRQTQMRLIFEWVARKPLPAAVLDRPNISPVRIKSEDTEILALLNASYDTAETICLQWCGSGNSSGWQVLERDGRWRQADVIIKEDEGIKQVLEIKRTLHPAEMQVFRNKTG